MNSTTAHPESVAYEEGFDAFNQGLDDTELPFVRGSIFAQDWLTGYHDAQKAQLSRTQRGEPEDIPTSGTTHFLKISTAEYPAFYDARRMFIILENNGNYQVGDILWLREVGMDYPPKFTQRSCYRQIVYTHDDTRRGVAKGYVVLGLTYVPQK